MSRTYFRTMPASTRVIDRRTFLRDLGHGAVAVAIIGLAGCTRAAPRSFDPVNYAGNLDEIESFWCLKDLPSAPPVEGQPDPNRPDLLRWGRAGDDRTSGYVLARGGEATIVDTGSWCVPDVIEGGLRAVGLGWPAVSSIIVTHKHPDHWVGLSAALDRATDAVVFAGAADIPRIASARPIKPVGAGDRVMDLAIVPTPGHTPGHIAVHDEVAGVLAVGDAVGNAPDGNLTLLPSGEDLAGAKASVRALARLSFDTLLPGHGAPIIGGAWDKVSDFLARN
jgi:glyoxylase-like metal-dependent hydrolase (beta-lactamase superfamily II)